MDVKLARFRDFHRLARDARLEGRLLVVLVSQVDCPYCELIKREIIHPMIKGRDFEGEILLGEIMIDDWEWLVDFDGNRVAAADFAHAYGVVVTPTLLFLDANGRELAKQMVGINTVEMYFYYVSESIKKALARLRAQPS